MESQIGQIIARNGILAIILAWVLFWNKGLTERLFTVIENNTRAMIEMREIIKQGTGHGNE